MKPHLFIGLSVISLLGSTVFSSAVPPGYVLKWSDEFNGNTLNTNFWNYRTGPRHIAYNTSAAVSVSNGSLVITTYTQDGTNFTGFIDTDQKVSNGYGYYEASIQFSNAPGNWSAFWLQSPNVRNTNSLNNPTNGVEIDIVEHRYSDRAGNLLADGGNTALHWNGYGADHRHTDWFSSNLGRPAAFIPMVCCGPPTATKLMWMATPLLPPIIRCPRPCNSSG